MRELTGHKVNPANDQLTVTVRDGPGAGGACHEYEIRLPDGSGLRLAFQNGPIAETGVNGITHEVLLAILMDRLEGFQSGPFRSDYNENALYHLMQAQTILQARTKERMARGVEGTHQL
jgi:hypothetical protein